MVRSDDIFELSDGFKVDVTNETDFERVTVTEKVRYGKMTRVCVHYDGEMRNFILHWLCGGRCVTCRKVATEVNHIIPKARGQQFRTWKNQIAQCSECHHKYHDGGVTESKIADLILKRREFLMSVGKEQFV